MANPNTMRRTKGGVPSTGGSLIKRPINLGSRSGVGVPSVPGQRPVLQKPVRTPVRRVVPH